MPDAPWRCSQCGTVNEPSANACRTCGRWPSLFDLQSGVVGTTNGDASQELDVEYEELQPFPDEPSYAPEPEPVQAAPATMAPAPETASGTAMDAGSEPKRTKWRGPEPAIPELPAGTWVRRLSRIAVPVAVAAYVLISALTR
jgi:hypothetical protein